MATMSVVCQCGRSLLVGTEHAGRRAACPFCDQPVLIPHPAIPEASEGIIETEPVPLPSESNPRRSTI